MQPIEGGLWIVLGIAMALAAVISLEDFSGRGDNIVQRMLSWLFMYACMVPVAVAVLCFFGGITLLGWQSYTYLRFGNWPDWRISHVLHLLGSDFSISTGWIGVDRTLLEFLDWSALLALLLVVPFTILIVLGILVWIALCLWKAIQ
jgi:hypothetical protein